MYAKKRSALLYAGILIGIVIGLVISSNFDWVRHSIANDRGEAVPLGANEPVSQELLGLQGDSSAIGRGLDDVAAVLRANSAPPIEGDVAGFRLQLALLAR